MGDHFRMASPAHRVNQRWVYLFRRAPMILAPLLKAFFHGAYSTNTEIKAAAPTSLLSFRRCSNEKRLRPEQFTQTGTWTRFSQRKISKRTPRSPFQQRAVEPISHKRTSALQEKPIRLIKSARGALHSAAKRFGALVGLCDCAVWHLEGIKS